MPNVEISKHENKSILYSGAPLLLQCSLNLTDLNSTTLSTNQWLKNSSIITNSSKTSQCITVSSPTIYVAELFIYPLNASTDAGEYQCNMTVCGNDSVCSNSFSEALTVAISGKCWYDIGLITLCSHVLTPTCSCTQACADY